MSPRFLLLRKTIATALSIMVAALFANSIYPYLTYASPQSDFDEASAAATAASEAYEEALTEQQEAQIQLDEATTRFLQSESELVDKQTRAARAMRDMYVSQNDFSGMIDMVCSCDSFEEVLHTLDSFERIKKHRENELVQGAVAKQEAEQNKRVLEQAKQAVDIKVEESLTAKQAALDTQEEAREALSAYQAEQQAAQQQSYSYSYPSSSTTYSYAPTSSSWNDEESAKAYIIGKESGGNYSARNGRYYGAYQLTESYLGGDYSPENQDRVAQSYVEGRYGSWSGAAAFWDSHGWY